MDAVYFATTVSRVNFTEPHAQERPKQAHTNIALVDASLAHAPVLYVLRQELGDADLTSLRHPNAGKDALVILGRVLSIDRQKKYIHLSDQTIVFYNHLILFNAPPIVCSVSAYEECASSGAVQVLVSALRCVPIRSPHLQTITSSRHHRICALPGQTGNSLLRISSLQQLRSSPPRRQELRWTGANRWLFQVQS